MSLFSSLFSRMSLTTPSTTSSSSSSSSSASKLPSSSSSSSTSESVLYASLFNSSSTLTTSSSSSSALATPAPPPSLSVSSSSSSSASSSVLVEDSNHSKQLSVWWNVYCYFQQMKRDAPITSELFLLWLSGPAEGDEDSKEEAVPVDIQIWHHVFARYVGHIIDQLKLPLEWILVSQLQTYGYQLILRLAREIQQTRCHALPALLESEVKSEDEWYQTTYSKYKKTSSTREQLVIPPPNDLEIVLNAIRVADKFVRSLPNWELLTFTDPMMKRLFDAILDQYNSALLHHTITIDHQTIPLSSLLDTRVTSNHRAWLTQITNYIHDEMPVMDYLSTKESYLIHFEPEESEEDNNDDNDDEDEQEDEEEEDEPLQEADEEEEEEEEEEEKEQTKKSKY